MSDQVGLQAAGGVTNRQSVRVSTVTVHMAASLDGYIARLDGSVDWLDTSDEFPEGTTMDPEIVEEFLKTIDCYVMGSHTYELAISFAEKGLGWAYGDKPVFVLTRRGFPPASPSVQFLAGDLHEIFNDRLRPKFSSIWVVGGGMLCGACLRLGLVDDVRYSILPVAIGEGIPFFRGLQHDVPLHLKEVEAYRSGMVGLWYETRAIQSRTPGIQGQG